MVSVGGERVSKPALSNLRSVNWPRCHDVRNRSAIGEDRRVSEQLESGYPAFSSPNLEYEATKSNFRPLWRVMYLQLSTMQRLMYGELV